MENEIIDILSKWICIKSVYDKKTADVDNPFGINISKAIQYFCDLGNSEKFIYKNLNNKVGYIEYGDNTGGYVDIFGHCDVVDADSSVWKYDPFKLTVEGDKIIGRGVSDNKGALVACFLALKEIKKEGIKLKKAVRIIAGGNEESGFECIRHYYKTEPKGIYGLVPDAKFPIINGEKGSLQISIKTNITDKNIKINTKNAHNVIPSYLEINTGSDILQIKGIGGHSSKPENADNPILKAIKYLYDIDKNILNVYKLVCNDNRNGKLLELNKYGKCGIISIVPTGINVNDGVINIVLDIRYPENINYKDICKKFDNYIKHKCYNTSASYKYIKSANYVDENCKFIQDLYKIYIKHTNDIKTKIRTTNAGTYASEMANAIIFGCEFLDGSSGGVHAENEFNSIESIKKAKCIYKDAIIHLCNVL